MTAGIFGLVGAFIGGIIGIVLTIVQQHYAESRWKKETKLKYLRDERTRLAEQYQQVGVTWRKSAQESDFPDEVVSLIAISLPSEIAKAFNLAISELKSDRTKWATITGTFAKPMRESLEAIDEEIKELLS